MNDNSSDYALAIMEQFYRDNLPSDQNVDPDCFGYGSGYHRPMPEEMRKKLRIERGTAFFVYDVVNKVFLYKFESIELAQSSLNVHRQDICKGLKQGVLYLNRILFSLGPLSGYNIIPITLEGLKAFIKPLQKAHNRAKHPDCVIILAENVQDSSLTKTYSSLAGLAEGIKGDRGTIRKYQNDPKFIGKVYRKEWIFTKLNK